MAQGRGIIRLSQLQKLLDQNFACSNFNVDASESVACEVQVDEVAKRLPVVCGQ